MSREFVSFCYINAPGAKSSLNFRFFLPRMRANSGSLKGFSVVLNVEGMRVLARPNGQSVELLHNISFTLEDGEVFVLVGESGSGKTTLARALTNLFPRNLNISVHGTVQFGEANLIESEPSFLRKVRGKDIRYIFQEPGSAFNPALRVRSQVRLLSSSRWDSADSSKKGRDESIRQSLNVMGIENLENVLRSYPHQLSVGTLQRILIAAAIAPRPRLLIADEPTSGVDATQRYQILDLLQSYCKTHIMALLLITHDLQIARRYGDRIAVLYAGRIVEISQQTDFFAKPLHPYSEMLLRSVPDASASLESIPAASGTVSSMADLPIGCKFHPRCPKVQMDCREQEPELLSIEQDRQVRCPYWK
jgi:oligopeptide/dipeptide ABC transporter ATP-binding protein